MGLSFYIPSSGPTYEDFTAYTEVDPSSDLTVDTNSIVVDTMTRGVDAGVYKDFGVDHFTGDFTFTWDFNFESSNGGSDSAASVFALTQNYLLTRDARDVGNNGFDIYISASAPNIITFLRDWQNDSADQTSEIYPPPKRFWFTLTRSGTSIALQIHTDASRTTLYDTLNINQSSAHAYRYLYPLSSLSSAWRPDHQITGTIRDLLYTT